MFLETLLLGAYTFVYLLCLLYDLSSCHYEILFLFW